MSFAPRTVLIGAIAILGMSAAIVGFAVREPIERAFFVRAARELTGLESLDVAHVERDGDAYVVDQLHAQTADGAFAIDVPTARIRVAGSAYRIALDAPRVRFDPRSYRDADRSSARRALERHGEDANVLLEIRNGSVSVGRVDATPMLESDRIEGTLDVRTARATFTGSLALEDRGRAFEIDGAPRDVDGVPAQHWSAEAMPIDAFAPFVAAGALARPLDGWLRDVDVVDGPAFHATARLEGVRVALGEHALHGLHGTLLAVGNGIGTRGIDGFLDAESFHAAGEVHDLRSHYRWLADGTDDLRSMAKLAAAIADEPQLHGPIELEATAPGLAFAQYGLIGDHGPVAISILAADPREPTLRFDTAIANDHIISGGERTSAMGLRTGAVGGVNGDYFDIGRTYQPQGMLLRAGALVRGPTDRAVVTIDKDKHVTFGEFHMRGSVKTAHGVLPITEFNDWPPGHASVITPAYGSELRPANATFVELTPLDAHRYRVVDVTPGIEPIAVHFGIAIGVLSHIPLPKLGEVVQLDYATDPPLGNAVAAIGGGPILLRDGAWYEDPHAPAPDERDVRWPVVALAHMKDGWLDLVAVDGRHPERSVGMTRPEFGDLLLRLGGVDAMALDSGGSVTLVSRAPGDANVSVRNVPSDDSAERWVSDALFLYSSAPPPTIVSPATSSTPMPEDRPSP